MIHQFTKENIETIGNVLGAMPKPLGDDVFRIEVINEEGESTFSFGNTSWIRYKQRANEYGVGILI